MSEIFIHLFNLSVSTSWLIAAVVIIRLVFKKLAPRWTVCLLWAVVGLRLIVPFSIESDISLIPSSQTLNPDAINTLEVSSDVISDTVSESVSDSISGEASEFRQEQSEHEPIILPPITNIDKTDTEASSGENSLPQAIPDEEAAPETAPDKEYVQSGIKPVDDRVNTAISSKVSEDPNKNPLKTFADIGSIVWMIGVAIMAGYAIINYLVLRGRVAESIPDGNSIRRCENVASPFILGIFKPRIYLPFGLSPETESLIIAHERAHLKRLDHLIKPFGYMLLAVYWFNPLIWIAYILLCRDIETACDEKVVEKMSIESRKAYAGALLECGIKRSSIAACPVAFGEVGVKQRVKNALTYKKPMFWIIIVAIILTITVSVFFLTSPPKDNNADKDVSSESTDSSENSEESQESKDNSSDVSDDASENSTENSETTAESIKYEGDILAYTDSGPADRYLDITDEEAQKIRDIVNSGSWTEEAAELVGTHVITIGNDDLVYDSVGGNIVDFEKGRTLPLTEDEKAVIDSALTEEEKQPSAMQSTHQTPEDLNVKSDRLKYHGGDLTPTYIQLSDVDLMFERSGDRGTVPYGATDESVIEKGIIKKSGLKIWICTESGKKIDYVYSNSDGLFRFECPVGTYTFLFDSDVYVDKYVHSITVSGKFYSDSRAIDYPYFEAPVSLYPIKTDYINNAIVYRDIYENFRVKVIDSETKEPLKNAKVTLDERTVYTDGDGIAVYAPLMEYVSGRSSSFAAKCECDGYLPVLNTKSAGLYQTYMEIELEPIHEYDFSITVLDYYTNEPVSGVEITYDLNEIYADAQFENTITGKDGTIKGKITSDEFRHDIIIKYTKTYTLPNGNTYTETEYCDISLDKNNLNVTVKLTLGTYNHALRQI